MSKTILAGLILLTAALFTLIYLTFEQYLIAALALIAGVIWLRLPDDRDQPLTGLFFLFYLGLAVLVSLIEASVLLVLVGVCANLAAWDLSRFRARIAAVGPQEIEPGLEAAHLRRLFAATGIGLVIALLPLVGSIPADFVFFAVLALTLMFVLRASMLHIRRGQQNDQV